MSAQQEAKVVGVVRVESIVHTYHALIGAEYVAEARTVRGHVSGSYLVLRFCQGPGNNCTSTTSHYSRFGVIRLSPW